jgi:hypothetical protein
MKQITVIDMHPGRYGFRIYDAVLSFRDTVHDFTDQEFDQGFSHRPGSYNFSVLGDCMGLTTEVRVADELDAVHVRPDTVRAIMVPFSFSNSTSGFGISNLDLVVETIIHVAAREYALVFEIKLRNDPEYLNSPQYQENVEGGFTEEYCYLTLYPREEPVQPEILRLDTWTSAAPPSQSYAPLNPTYPLLMDI